MNNRNKGNTMSKFKRFITILMLVASFNAFSIEGAFEINQACVATGCFPGDTAGLPVTISNEGSYVLTSNIEILNGLDNGIQISVENVSVDMNGFMIRGTNSCPGNGVIGGCTFDGGGNGIAVTTTTIGNISIKNGFISGMGNAGIILGINSKVENITLDNNYLVGISVSQGSLISDCISTFNGWWGFKGENASIKNSSVLHNGQWGLLISKSTISNVMSKYNRAGLFGAFNTITESDMSNNTEVGIWANGGNKVMNSYFRENAGVGLNPISNITPLLMDGNTLSLNNGGNENSQIGGVGTFIEVGVNFCGTDTVCN